ncbi:ABC transporter ATP-binding protein [Nocardia sp. NPDC060249]|uniref:ABC transporter ATP-binding protein n=1 Tax=Nocardia sp. NPDC060249 TaxID=3347082 RepID=UPI00366190F7
MRPNNVGASFLDGLRARLQLLRLLRVASPSSVSVLIVVCLVQAALPAATGIATGWMVSGLASRPDSTAVAVSVLLVGVLMWASEVSESIVSAERHSVSRQIDAWHRDHLAWLVSRPVGIDVLERPDVQDELAIGLMKGLPGWISYTLGSGVVGQLVIVGRIIGAILAAIVLACFSWPVAVGALVCAQVLRILTQRAWLVQHAIVRELAPVARHADYWADIATSQWAAKELRLFGLIDWVVTRYRGVVGSRTDRLAQVRLLILHRLVAISVALIVTAATGMSLLAHAILTGRVDAGVLAICLATFLVVLASSRRDNESFDVEFAGIPALASMERLTRHTSVVPTHTPKATTLPSAPPRVRFESVGFTYPTATRPALRDVDLEIGPGKLVALVGINGAGKTTLTKLLGSLYEPTRGRITVDGVDLRSLDPAYWRHMISVVFQEFNRYELPLCDNIALGAGHATPDPHELAQVAAEAGIEDLVARGWDTTLASTYHGGVELSGGQWQRIALARAAYAVAAGARLLVLDEPTAHLDVAAERDVLDRVLRTARGAGVLLISHRLATVRHADRIVVLDDGRITEAGTHQQLMEAEGTYAHMYRLQADRFTDTEEVL